MVTIVDYKVGNLGSIQNMLKRLGCPSEITSDVDKIRVAQKLILPGVGAFDSGVNSIKRLGLWETLDNKARKDKVPILGICLGMQLLCNTSEEGEQIGFGWIDAEVVRFRPSNNKQKVPHMGWNYLDIQKDSKLFYQMYTNPKFYFVHSYYVNCFDASVIGKAKYGQVFDAAVEKENILGTQFHPEKSHKFGMKLLENFIKKY